MRRIDYISHNYSSPVSTGVILVPNAKPTIYPYIIYVISSMEFKRIKWSLESLDPVNSSDNLLIFKSGIAMPIGLNINFNFNL